MKVKTELKTCEGNTSVNCVKYEDMCLRGKLPRGPGPRGSPINQESVWNVCITLGIRKIGRNRWDIAMFTMKTLMGFLLVFVF